MRRPPHFSGMTTVGLEYREVGHQVMPAARYCVSHPLLSVNLSIRTHTHERSHWGSSRKRITNSGAWVPQIAPRKSNNNGARANPAIGVKTSCLYPGHKTVAITQDSNGGTAKTKINGRTNCTRHAIYALKATLSASTSSDVLKGSSFTTYHGYKCPVLNSSTLLRQVHHSLLVVL